jgi:hypothetical protein
MEYTGVLKPVDASLLPATSMDQFIAGSLKIRSDLEELALKAKASQP